MCITRLDDAYYRAKRLLDDFDDFPVANFIKLKNAFSYLDLKWSAQMGVGIYSFEKKYLNVGKLGVKS